MEIELTTDHPTSSHGVPVAIVDGAAYGPDDVIGGVPVGSTVYLAVQQPDGHPDLVLARRFLAASPVNGPRWLAGIERFYSTPRSEFCDE